MCGLSKANTWVSRLQAEGEAGLVDRSSRPHTSPRRAAAEIEDWVVELGRREQRGPAWIGAELCVPARSVNRPGIDGGFQPPKHGSHGGTEELPRRAA
ncbi:leucine zipper domain-containing protein [Blastococcus sp. URHD0036]|uniref:leucine zipper domain-containing protein n=1 Tax=Blastococcus sp. URHD0036 TaxID=1380356 RepID=UPI00350FF149